MIAACGGGWHHFRMTYDPNEKIERSGTDGRFSAAEIDELVKRSKSQSLAGIKRKTTIKKTLGVKFPDLAKRKTPSMIIAQHRIKLLEI